MATLNPNELDALMQAIRSGDVPTEDSAQPPESVTKYDLTSQDRIIRGQMPTVDSINDVIASHLASGLQGRIRTQVRATAHPASMLKFMDMHALLAAPATVAVLSLGVTHGLAVVVLDSTLTRALLTGALGDRKFRADTGAQAAKRDLTSVEKLVLRKLLTLLTTAMESAWAAVLPLRPEILRFESDPRLAMIAAPKDVAILTTIDLEIGTGITGTMHIGLPYAAVESVKKQLSLPPRARSQADARFVNALTAEMRHVELHLTAELGRAHTTLGELLKLGVGDVISLDSNEEDPIPLYVQGRVKFVGHPRVSHGRMALGIEREVHAEPEHGSQPPSGAPRAVEHNGTPPTASNPSHQDGSAGA